MEENQSKQNVGNPWSKLVAWINSTSLFKFIKLKTRNEWSNAFKTQISATYQTLTNSSEKSLLIGFLAGVLVVIFPMLIFKLLLLLLLIALLIWFIADESREEAEDHIE